LTRLCSSGRKEDVDMSSGAIARRSVLVLSVLAALGALLIAGPVLARTTSPVVTLEANLTGKQEVPGPGDRNGSGDAKLIVSKGKVCYVLRVEDIKRPTAAHIHEGRRGVAGPIVVELKAPKDGSSSGCERISRELSRNLREHPKRYYVNVHNNQFPAGAIRGQLSQ
jgi:hypothetical protein